MKRFSFLFSLILVLVLISACGSTQISETSAVQTPSPTPSITQTPSPTPSETQTPSPTPSETQTLTPTPSETQTPTPTTSTAPKYALLISVTPAGGGSVKIANPPDGEFDYEKLQALAEIKTNYNSSYEQGKSLMLAAKATEGYVFESWSGDLSGTTDVLYINVESNMNIVANFKAEVTQAPLPTIEGTLIRSKTILSKTSLTIGENLTIQSEIEYVGYESTISGIPLIIILDSDYRTVAQWFLDQQGNLLTGFNSSMFYEIEKGEKYVMDVTWDLTKIYPYEYVSSGQYEIQASIAIPYTPGFSLLVSDEGSLTITVTNDNPEQSPSTTTPSLGYDVFASTILSAMSLSVGESLTIQTEIQYVGDEAPSSGLPVIMILNPDWTVVAEWYLDEQDVVDVQNGLMEYYQIEKDKKYIMSVTWNLKNLYTGSFVSPGQYIIWATIAIPYDDGFSPITTNEELSVTII